LASGYPEAINAASEKEQYGLFPNPTQRAEKTEVS
jgi:hypothetical protein